MGDVSQLTPDGTEPAAGVAAAGQAGARRFFGRLVREQPLGTAGGVVILILVLVSIFADGLAPYRFEEIHLREPPAGPFGPVPAGHRPRGPRPAEPPHPTGRGCH